MNRKIQADGFVVDQKLVDFIETKTDKLTTFFDKIIDLDVKLKTDSHQKIKDKVVHMLCHIPNNNLFVEATAKSFEEATDEAVEDLKRQIKRKKEIALGKSSGGSADAIQDRDWEDYDD
jgi:putative sigma-54 modulation protein